MREEKHRRFVEMMNLIESGLSSERQLAEVLGVSNTHVRRWKKGIGSPDIEVFEAAASALGWSMDQTIAFLNNQELTNSPSKNQIFALVGAMPLAEVLEVVELGLSRLSEAAKEGALNMNELKRLIQQEMTRLGLDEAGYARKVRLSPSVLRQIMNGVIPGNPKTKLGNLAANLTNPRTYRPFRDWEELAQFCGIEIEASYEEAPGGRHHSQNGY